MKIIERTLPWTNKERWAWPEHDEKLIQVFDQVADIDIIMRHVNGNQICIQAGGACGLWPYRFADFFERVYTFEPLVENYQCMEFNICDKVNIVPSSLALSNTHGVGSMRLHPSEQGNAGAAYFDNGDGDINCTTIDFLDLNACDLIQLDIEGHEIEALEGAAKTIEKFHPVIVIEEKRLPQMERDYKLSRELIESWGYREVAAIHRDVIFAYKK